MEEDIKILEELKDAQERCVEHTPDSPFTMLWKKQNQAIENLLKRYKELEEGCKTCVVRNDLNDYVENSIPISVIQNKCIELEYQTLYINGITDKTETQIASLGALMGKIQVLQELLEERNK